MKVGENMSRDVNLIKKLWAFYHANFNEKFCEIHFVKGKNQIYVTDQKGDRIDFLVKNGHIFSPDTRKAYS